MYAQLRGNNQGIIKVTTKGIARDPTATPVVVEHETMLSACLNGNKNAGMVVLSQAMDVAAKNAAEHGFGICGTNNTSTSTGALEPLRREPRQARSHLARVRGEPRVCGSQRRH